MDQAQGRVRVQSLGQDLEEGYRNNVCWLESQLRFTLVWSSLESLCEIQNN